MPISNFNENNTPFEIFTPFSKEEFKYNNKLLKFYYVHKNEIYNDLINIIIDYLSVFSYFNHVVLYIIHSDKNINNIIHDTLTDIKYINSKNYPFPPIVSIYDDDNIKCLNLINAKSILYVSQNNTNNIDCVEIDVQNLENTFKNIYIKYLSGKIFNNVILNDTLPDNKYTNEISHLLSINNLSTVRETILKIPCISNSNIQNFSSNVKNIYDLNISFDTRLFHDDVLVFNLIINSNKNCGYIQFNNSKLKLYNGINFIQAVCSNNINNSNTKINIQINSENGCDILKFNVLTLNGIIYDIENNKNDFESKLKQVDNNEILYKDEYSVQNILIKSNAINTFIKKIWLGNQISFHTHRSGWSYALTQLSKLQTKSGIYVDGYTESSFGWKSSELINNNKLPYNIPWIGFMHNMPNIPGWYSSETPLTIIKSNAFQDSLQYCKGIYTLSNYLNNYIKLHLPDIPVNTVMHPTEIPKLQFSIDAFNKNKNKKIISIGWWGRKYTFFYKTVVPSYIKKARLLSSCDIIETRIQQYMDTEQYIYNMYLSENDKNSVITMPFASNDMYDMLLSENIAYCMLHDSSANNAIIECIARGTPIVVNKLPAVVEYLGNDYPLYINDNCVDLTELLCDMDLLEYTSKYLISRQYLISTDMFLNMFVNSDIYQSL